MYQPSRRPVALNTTRPGPGRAHQPSQDDAGEGQILDALARQAGDALQRPLTGVGHHAPQLLRFIAADFVVMNHAQRVTHLLHVNAGERTERSADEVDVTIFGFGDPGNGLEIGD